MKAVGAVRVGVGLAAGAKTLLLSGEHLVLVVVAVVGAHLMATMPIGPVNWSTAASLHQQQMTNRAYLKRPGRGVPPPRSGSRPPVVTHNGHALLYKCVVSVAEHFQALRVYAHQNSVRAWGAS
jgi:hypothetical protein